MNQCSLYLLLLFMVACNTESGKKSTLLNNSTEMPAAIQQLTLKIEQSPDSIGLHLQMVDALDSIGSLLLALREIDRLIKNDSLNYGLWYRKALLQENAKDTVGALQSYTYAIRIYPSPDALLAAANLLAEQKNPTALVLCNQVAKLRMGREYAAHSFFISGVYYARTGDRAKALTSFNRCIYNDQNYMVAYMEKGFLFYDQSKTKEALQVFETVIMVKNTYSDGYYWLAKCHETLKNRQEAIIHYQKSLTLNPKLIEATVALKKLGVK